MSKPQHACGVSGHAFDKAGAESVRRSEVGKSIPVPMRKADRVLAHPQSTMRGGTERCDGLARQSVGLRKALEAASIPPCKPIVCSDPSVSGVIRGDGHDKIIRKAIGSRHILEMPAIPVGHTVDRAKPQATIRGHEATLDVVVA